MQKQLIRYFLLGLLPLQLFAQGSWNPAGFDPAFPRTLLDSTDVPIVRATLRNPDHLNL